MNILKAGNWVQFKDNYFNNILPNNNLYSTKFFKIKSLGNIHNGQQIYFYNIDMSIGFGKISSGVLENDIEPILLDANLLANSKFKWDDYKNHWYYDNFIIDLNQIEFVHQLQNSFFEKMGKDLNIEIW